MKIAFADFWKGFEVNWDFITPILKKHFDFTVDNNNPDILFCSTLHGMAKAEQYNCPKILFVFESHPTTGYRDVEFTFSYDKDSDTNFYFPEWHIHTHVHPELIDKLLNRPRLDFKDAKFCSFVYSNESGEQRNKLFHELSKYKQVSSYGGYLRNDNSLDKVFNGVAGYSKEDYFIENPHKFAICYERDSLPGYCSEKLMNGFLSGSIPIYWGDPNAEEYFNANAFINATNMSLDELIKMIKCIDKYDDWFDCMVKAPVFTKEQEKLMFERMNNFNTVLNERISKILSR